MSETITDVESRSERKTKKLLHPLVFTIIICALIPLAIFVFGAILNRAESYAKEDLTTVVEQGERLKRSFDLEAIQKLQLPIYIYKFHDSNLLYLEESEMKSLSLDTMKTQTLGTVKTDEIQEALSEYYRGEPSHNLQYFVYRKPLNNEVDSKFNKSFSMLIYDTKNSKLHKVGVNKTGQECQKLFLWSSTGDDYVFWQDDHLYYSESPTSDKVVRITEDTPSWVHGILDWLYMEEIYDRNDEAVYWSLKGDNIAFLSYKQNPRAKGVFMISYAKGVKYPKVVELKYPKTYEEVLPRYVVTVWNKRSRELKQIDPPLRKRVEYHYIFRSKWIIMEEKEYLVVTYANRLQTAISIIICDVEAGICKLVYEYKYPNKTYAEPSDFDSIHSNDSLYILLPHPMSDGNSYQHIAKLKIKGSSDVQWAEVNFLSLGNFDVDKLVAYDKATDTVYFKAMAPNPRNLHMYSTKGTPSGSEVWKCATCRFPNCTYQSVLLDSNFTYATVACKGPAPQHYYSGVIEQGKVEKWNKMFNTMTFQKSLEEVSLPQVLTETVALGNGYEALVKIVLPPDPSLRSRSRSLPVLLYVYAGPGPLVATDSYISGNVLRFLYEGYAVVTIDGRGTTGRGWKYRSALYGAFGTVEIDDQLSALRKVLMGHPYLDASRLTVYGWSYGGYASALLSERARPGFFKCAISIAPVANFLYYDATYTERYMGIQASSAFYENDITMNVANFKETRLLLVHGLYDENVHFQNSALFMKALQREAIDFDLMVYPNKDHGINHRHLEMKTSLFLEKCAKR
ncbi:unnamed protein product [Cylicocyclus nassatus]|uniref:Uncharacterized protein n=1 Tax=Cylicocyclus nassatus TaxID=53992 RepID=A0AA36GJP0_CYLNA|nr:unnamed protein product [Cylicocyclus nassatus]